MPLDIFKLFPKSIETIRVKKQARSTYETSSPEYIVSLDAIVKRRQGFAEVVSESEDYQSNTSIHFRRKDAQYVIIGNYVEVDGEWHSIIEVKDGKNFDAGQTEFIRVVIGNDILNEPEEPNWEEVVSA